MGYLSIVYVFSVQVYVHSSLCIYQENIYNDKTVIFVTHNIQEAVFLSNRICVLSPHPGRLSAVIDVNLPRPRTMDMKNTQEFTELVAKVRGSFEGV